ncbi:MAG: dephospho-CoA kinase [Deltaproteobacteria bacterium]|nr:dephospho-CoA kinase [Deltaproteobacteria bacterium]
MAIRVFGLTGGVASGKSTVATLVREAGIEVIDADALAREVVAVGSEGLAELVRVFGAEILESDGSLDRARLAQIVFSDPVARRDLNAIVHPRIREVTGQRVAALEGAGEPLACYEAALLVENGLADAYRPLVVVALSKTAQQSRLMARDGIDEAEADGRLAAQLPLADKIAVADYVIHNDGPRATLAARVGEVLAAIRKQASPTAGSR